MKWYLVTELPYKETLEMSHKRILRRKTGVLAQVATDSQGAEACGELVVIEAWVLRQRGTRLSEDGL